MESAAVGYLGVDIGGTNLRGALVLSDTRIVSRFSQKTAIGQGAASFIERVCVELEQVISQARSLGMEVGGVGLGIPGLIGADGLIHASVNLRPLEGMNLAAILADRLGLPAAAGNDANLGALGEAWCGAGRDLRSMVLITIGTGLGSGLVLDGRLWSGAGGFAAEFGHITVDPEGLPCPCGNRGCLEQYASAAALSRFGGGRPPEELAALATIGDPTACAAFETLGRWLGIALAGLLNTLNLEGIVIGGGVAASFPFFEPTLRRVITERAFSQMAERLSIRAALLGDDAGLVGAARYAEEMAVRVR